MKANKMSARIFSMLLVVVLLLGSALPGASAATGSEDFIRVFHLDVGRKYFTVNQVTELIDAISSVGYTHMELAIGNEGLRLLLDDMSVTANGTTYSSDKVSAGIKAGNKAYSHSGEWSQSEMDAIISHAASRNIEIIPLVNNPGHMSAMLDAAEYVGISSPAYSAKISSGGWWGSTSTKTSSTTVSLSNANAVAFTKALVKKYVDYFAAKGCEYFNLGADEYAADVHSSGSMGFGYMQSNGWYDDFVNYINEVAAIIKAAGMKPVAFNDGIYFNENDDTAFDRDIIIAYWIPSWGTYYVASPAYLVSKGHKILNTNDDWYYVLGKTDGYGYNNAYNGVNNTPVTRVGDGSTMKLSNLTGSMICVWSDDPGVNYESYKSNVLYFIETLAAKNPDYFVVNAHEHTYETVTVDATCTEAGSITTTCTGCGDQTVEVIEALGHAYDYVETAATCGQDGSVMHTCIVCGDSYSEAISATGNHSYASVKEDATCVAAGSVTYTCTVCGDSYTETIPATGKHIYKSETVNATCVADGYTTHTCAFCSDSYTEAVPATGHNYSCAVTGATCTADGSSVYTCSVCGDSYTEVIPATGHDYAGVITGATCLEGGFTTYTCQGCGDSYVADYTDARGHRYETATVEATCTTDGSVTYYCACGDSYTETIPAAGHNHQAVVTAPTCTAGGYTTHTCAGCGDSYVTNEQAALGHQYETVTVAPTCTASGYTTSTCTACGDSYIAQQTEALGHNYVSVTVEPTETEEGYTTHTCHTCGHSYTDNYVDALGHTIVSVVTDPTCESEGYTTHTCTVCGEVTVDNYVPALGHNYQTVTVDATCTTDGSVSGTCTNCGDSYENVTAAYGHSYTTAVTAPSCTEGGYTVYSCDRCGDNYVADYTEALGHNYSRIVTDVTCTEDGYTTHLCVGCGDSYVGETVAATGHNYESVTAEATCTENGSVTYTCVSCGDSYAEEIPATGHDHAAVVTDPTCTAAGYTTYTCACGDSYIADETLALGHSYSSEEVGGNLVYTCDACGDTYTVTTGWVAMSGSYALDTDGIETGENHKYIIVGSNKDYALTLSGSTIGAAKVTVHNNVITLEDASAYEFYFRDNSSKESGSYLLTQDGSKGVYHMGGDMYYGSDNKGYWHIGSGSNGAYQLYDYDNSTWYLNYGYVWGSDSVSRFAVSSTARNVRLFKAMDSYVRISGKLTQTWEHGADVTESAVLEQVKLQTSTDGITADTTAAIHSSMVIWDKPFDGYTAGTYTAAVHYNGVEIGTITVVVTGEHTYESSTVEATCTQQGSTTHTCTACGTGYTDNYVEALGHSYTSVETDEAIVYTCDRCGDSYTESLAKTYTKVSAISSGDNYVITLYSGRKYYALSHAGNKLSAVQVTFSDNTITSEITENLVWNYSGNKLSYADGGKTYYLYASASNNWWGNWWGSSSYTLSLSNSNSSTVSFSNSRLKVGSSYLRYSNGSVSLSSSATTTYCFVEK